MENNVGLYYEGAMWATKHGEADKFREHIRMMDLIAGDLSRMVSANIDGYIFHADKVAVSLSEYPFELVRVVIAHMVRNREFDGRISRAVKQWALSVKLPVAFGSVTGIEDRIHSVYLNALAEEVMKREI